jgi:single-strand selective monofunctional uracil DNA glycosylase
MGGKSKSLIEGLKRLNKEISKVKFPANVAYVYNPLDYAFEPMEIYFKNFADTPKKTLFLGMNPGPFGMMQTGVPFGEIASVTDWMGIRCEIKGPKLQHPKRPIEGFNCKKSEVSGKRLWGLFSSRFKNPKDFFRQHFVINYCPLGFLEAGGKNLTPDKFPKSVQDALFEPCDRFLKLAVNVLEAQELVGVGDFAYKCFKRNFETEGTHKILRIIHPSPASPLANKDWPGNVSATLLASGVW